MATKLRPADTHLQAKLRRSLYSKHIKVDMNDFYLISTVQIFEIRRGFLMLGQLGPVRMDAMHPQTCSIAAVILI